MSQNAVQDLGSISRSTSQAQSPARERERQQIVYAALLVPESEANPAKVHNAYVICTWILALMGAA